MPFLEHELNQDLAKGHPVNPAVRRTVFRSGGKQPIEYEYLSTSDCTGKTDLTCSQSLDLATMVFVLCAPCLRGLLVQAIDPSLFIWPVVQNSCGNDSEGCHALLRMTGSELQIHINLADGKSA